MKYKHNACIWAANIYVRMWQFFRTACQICGCETCLGRGRDTLAHFTPREKFPVSVILVCYSKHDNSTIVIRIWYRLLLEIKRKMDNMDPVLFRGVMTISVPLPEIPCL